ncbi:MAG: alpha-L-fucosidase [Christensenellales bacterium]|jgi:alpha-L-fucosidase
MKDTRQQWFKEAKYGLFIHWGLYSALGGEYKGRRTDWISEWIMNTLQIPVEEYEKIAQEFNPVNFDADEYVRKAAQWGMKYIVFTSKHHDGFAMYDSKCSDYNIVKATPFGRDIIKELKEACDRYGLRLGLYYSQSQDWHDPNGYRDQRDDKNKADVNAGKDFRKYLDEKCIPQLKEILTQYGDIALIWFDTPMGITQEQSRELADIVKSIQPNCLVSGRIGNDVGEYNSTGDNFIPLLPYPGDWEVPATLNESWGYKKDDHNWRSPDEILRLLLKINSRGGNYLLNIGPDGLGNIPEGSVKVLDAVGDYIKRNGEAIYATKSVPFYPYDLEWCVMTRKDHRLFLNILKPNSRFVLTNFANTVKKVTLLETGEELFYQTQPEGSDRRFIRIRVPVEYRTKRYYAIEIETEEAEPIFEPISL